MSHNLIQSIQSITQTAETLLRPSAERPVPQTDGDLD